MTVAVAFLESLSVEHLFDALSVLDLDKVNRRLSLLDSDEIAIIDGSTDGSTRARRPQMTRKSVGTRKVFRAPRAPRAKRVGNVEFLLDIDPFGVFELHVSTRNKKSLAADMVALPVTLEIVRVLASHKVARSILDSLDETALVRLWSGSRRDRMRAAEGAVLGFDLVRPRVTRVARVARLVVLLVVGPPGELFAAGASLGTDVAAGELEDARGLWLMGLLLVLVLVGSLALVGLVRLLWVLLVMMMMRVLLGLFVLVMNLDARSFYV